MTAITQSCGDLLDGRYRLGRELGHGGMATVYLAEDLRHSRQVAVKVLHSELLHGVASMYQLLEPSLSNVMVPLVSRPPLCPLRTCAASTVPDFGPHRYVSVSV